MTADPRRFLYRTLDPDAARRLAARHLSACDDGELYLQYAVNEAFGFDDGRLKTADYNASSGFGLRGVSGEMTAFSHANEISEAAIDRAAATLRLIDPAVGVPAAPPKRTNQSMYDGDDPLVLVPFAEKVALCERIDAAARARDPRVVQVSVTLAASWSVIDILRGGGFAASDIRPLVRLGVSIVVEQNGRRETGFHGIGGRHLYTPLFDQAAWTRGIDIALAQALANLESVAAPAGEMEVVLGPGWPGVLLHEAVGHGLEGDFNRKGSSAFSGRIGERVAAPGVTVIDDGAMLQRRGSLTIDDEGTPTGRTVLIEDGILVGYMQDRQSARLMNMAPTGNGRRQSYAHMPMARMTNTGMMNGTHKREAMIAETKRGLYCASFGGGQVDITNGKFVFQCTEAYLIEDGKITSPVKGATLIGDGPSALTRVTMIGDDFDFDSGVGVCGKNGQSVPVGVGQPSLKITGLTVGGTSL